MQRMEKINEKMKDQTLKHEYELMIQKNTLLKQLNDQKAVEDKSY